MSHSSSCVAVYSPSSEQWTKQGGSVVEVVKELLSRDFSVNKLSVIGKGSLTDDHTIGIYNTLDQLCYIGKQNAFWQDLWELLSGEAFFLIPEFGSLAVAGGMSSILLTEATLEETTNDTSTELGKALYRIGIPEGSVFHYESVLKSGLLMLIVQGNNKEIEEAGNLLELTQSTDISLHLI